MLDWRKNFSLILVAALIFFPLKLNKTEAAVSTVLNKTVEFYIGQDNLVRPSGSQFSFYFNNVIIPETPSVKSAIVEISGVSYNNSGNQTINVDLKQGSAGSGAGTNYVLSGTAAPRPFSLKYDAWQGGAGPLANIVGAGSYGYTLYLRGTSAGGTGSFSVSSAKLLLSYSYSSAGMDFLKTVKFLVDQKTGSAGSGIEANKNFSLTIPEQAPALRSVFVEVGGIASGNGVGTIGVSVVNQGSAASYTNFSVDLGSSSAVSRFAVRYDASASIFSSSFPGTGNYTLYLKGTGFTTNIWGAKIIITYKYSENAAGLPVSGYVISSTLDTGIVKGAAFNSLMWKGGLNGGKVELQLATSNCPGGQSDYPVCSIGVWGDSNTPYRGPDCTSASYYQSATDTPVEIMCANVHNNKRYFRYKALLCSNDCVTSGMNNPQVTDVIVNWAP